jgi:ribosomal protein S1
VGTTGSFEILSIDPEKKRIGLALVQDGARAAEAEELRDYAARTDVASSGAFGSLADKLRGALDTRRK